MEESRQRLADFARRAPALSDAARLEQALALASALPGVRVAGFVRPDLVPEVPAALSSELPPGLDLEALVEEAAAQPLPALATHADVPVAAVAVRAASKPIGTLVVVGHVAFAPDALFALMALGNVLSDSALLGYVEEALRRSEAHAQVILETTVDAVITIDESRRILSFNRAAERIFGYQAAEVIGQDVNVLMPDPYRSEHDAYVERYLQTGERRIIGIGREVTGLRKNGEVFPMDLAVSEVLLPQRLFTGIVRDISDRRKLEQEVLRVSDLERRRIGQDLHDGLGQMLTGIGLIAGGLARRARSEAPDLAEDVEEIVGLVREADAMARGLARGLVPVELEQGGLPGALERMVESVRRMFDVTCRLHVQGTELVGDSTAAMHLYRIVQEAVSNAARHSGASLISILLVLGEEHVRLRIRDDGKGLPPDLAERPQSGMGLRIMHYRARIIGASLEINSAPEGGTTILCTYRRGGQMPARSLEEQLRDLP